MTANSLFASLSTLCVPIEDRKPQNPGLMNGLDRVGRIISQTPLGVPQTLPGFFIARIFRSMACKTFYINMANLKTPLSRVSPKFLKVRVGFCIAFSTNEYSLNEYTLNVPEKIIP